MWDYPVGLMDVFFQCCQILSITPKIVKHLYNINYVHSSCCMCPLSLGIVWYSKCCQCDYIWENLLSFYFLFSWILRLITVSVGYSSSVSWECYNLPYLECLPFVFVLMFYLFYLPVFVCTNFYIGYNPICSVDCIFIP